MAVVHFFVRWTEEAEEGEEGDFDGFNRRFSGRAEGAKIFGMPSSRGKVAGGGSRGRRRKGIGRIGFGVPIPKERKMGRWTRDTLISVGPAAAATT